MNDREFIKYLEGKVASTISKHKLASKRDKVLVAVSGGKDSTTALYVLRKLGFRVEGIIIDQLLGEYSRQNLSNIKKFCNENNIKLHVVLMRDEFGCSVCYMQSVLESKGVKINTCSICGVIRRNILNRKARELKASKVATGHNADDEAQTLFMNMALGNVSQSARLGPVSGVIRSKKFVPRIKPLYFCAEAEVARYSKLKKFPVVYDPCPCAADSYRTHVKKLLDELESEHPGAKRALLENFMKLLPALRKEFAGAKLGECSRCGEPASGSVCRTCSILSKLETTA